MRRKNFKDLFTRQKHKLRKTLLEADMLIGIGFPADVILQVAENEIYTVRDILRDKRSINYESYFTKGAILIAEFSTKSELLRLIWASYQESSFLLAKYIDDFESTKFHPFHLDLL